MIKMEILIHLPIVSKKQKLLFRKLKILKFKCKEKESQAEQSIVKNLDYIHRFECFESSAQATS